jgi:hypothetical protein
MVYDNDTGTLVLFGGQTAPGGLSKDTWVWNGSTWTDFPGSKIQAPSARQLAAMAFDPVLHQLILFGGENAAGQPLGDTWAWNGASWYQVSPSGLQSPSARFGAGMSFDPGGQIVLFGGTGYDSQAPATTSTTGTTTTTTILNSTTSTPADTSPTTDALVDAGPPVSLADTWTWNGAGWTPETSAGPSARSQAAMVYDSTSGQTLLFGGQSDTAGSVASRLLSDTWIWTGTEWSAQKPKTTPPARTGATLSDGPELGAAVLFAGATTTTQLADTWLWTGTDWLQAPAAGGPVPVSGACAAYDAKSGSELVVGGTSEGSVQGTDYLLVVSPNPANGTATTTTTTPARISSKPSSPSGVRGGGSTIPSRQTTPVVQAAPGNTRAPLPGSATDLSPGSLVTLSGSGFRPNSMITITFHSNPIFIGAVLANQSGGFTATVTVPAKAPAGTHHFEASGTSSGGSVIQLVAAVTVLSLGHGSRTPLTETITLVGAALLIPAVAWLLMSLAGRVRRRSGPGTVT